ncbi:MAG: PH domain-containing protein [Coxiellaceae bacterium]|nr:PH domain-containing protein [Coxiellaceae bacterium]
MSYIQQNLLHDENVVYQTRPHWVIFMIPVVLAVLSLVLYGYLKTLSGFQYEIFGYSFYAIISLFVFLLAIWFGIKAYIFYQTSEYGVTDKRIVMKTGWIQRRSIEIFLEKVEAIYVDQTISGRIMGYGTVIIVGTGGSKDPFLYVPKPLEFRNRAQQQIDNIEERRHGAD